MLHALFGIAAVVAVLTNIIPAGQLALCAYVGLVVGLLLVVYELPAVIAHNRNHRQFFAILLLNIALGWTILGWIASLIWACSNEPVAFAEAQTVYRSPALPRRKRRPRSFKIRYSLIQIVRRPNIANARDRAA